MGTLEVFESGAWLPVYLKLEEARLFLGNLNTYRRFPKLTLFNLSAFLSAARSVTFHIQKQIVPSLENGSDLYERLREQFLSGKEAKFFIELRNVSEKQTYLPLSFEMMEQYPDEKTGQVTWVQRAVARGASPSKRHFGWLENVLNTEWTSYTQPRWLIDDYPGKDKELVSACSEHLATLQRFVEALRREIDARAV